MAKVTNSISLGGSGGNSIIVVANYSALPDPTTVSGLFYWVSNSQGTKWLPGSLGGTYYNSGLYYSNGTTWEFMNVPYQATQLEVDTGTNTDKFLTPKTFNDSTQLASKENYSNKTNTVSGNETSTTLYPSIKGLVDWITSRGFITNVITALGYTPENSANKGVANGYVPLNSSVKIDTTYFPDSILGQLLYGGVVDASTALATLTNNAKSKLGTGSSSITLTNNTNAITGYTANEGIYYIATVSGTFAGISFEVGDWLVSIGSAWVKVDNTDAISSFNTRTGAITLISGDVVSALGFTPISNLSPTLSGLVTITGDTQTGSSANGVLIASQVWNTTGSPTAIRLDITNTASGAASKLIDLLVGGVSRFAVDKSGSLSATVITSGGDVNASVTSAFTWGSTNSRATMFSPSNGIIRLSNATGTDFVRLQLGGTSSSFPSIKRNATAINFRLADDSADCPVTASNGTFSGNVILSGSSSVLRLKGYTVATLPSGTQGDLAFVTDALAPTYNGALTGGGAIVVKVFHNGTSWVSA